MFFCKHIVAKTNKNYNKKSPTLCKNSKKEGFYKILTGSVTGLCNGLFGGGGGMVAVPMLEFLLKRDEKTSHATAILIILPVTIISAITYILHHGIKFSVAFPVSIGTIAGGICGALLLKKLTSMWIIGIFSLIMLVAGIRMVFF